MKKSILTAGLLVVWVSVFQAHDLFLKLDSFFLRPNRDVSISLINGTFEKSENSIARNRMLDVSIVGPNSQRSHPDTTQWTDVGQRAVLDFKTGDAGTYVVGVSTAAKTIDLPDTSFNAYLKHDGVLDILEQREKDNELTKDALELYSKHVKAIVQVGDKRSDSFSAKLGYPVELVPLQNPYDLKKGDYLEVQFLRNGKPKANQLVYASYDGFHQHDAEGGHNEAVQGRTDENGLVMFQLRESGRWYIRLIHMEKLGQQPVASKSQMTGQRDIDYESNWTTLTFEIQ